ncbi:MAG: hypothetical protein IJ389_03375 [Clostridia bacterium]|nr:hypothetical protein [Clostridia bacterium]
MFFNREIAVTRDLERCNFIREQLANANIESFVVTNTPTNSGRHHGVPFSKSEYSYEYHVFVKRKNYAEAKKVLNK